MPHFLLLPLSSLPFCTSFWMTMRTPHYTPLSPLLLFPSFGMIMHASFHTPLIQVALLNLGTRLSPAVEAARLLEDTRSDVSVTVADARFMKPLDIDLLRTLATENEVLVTLEEGSVGGALKGIKPRTTKFFFENTHIFYTDTKKKIDVPRQCSFQYGADFCFSATWLTGFGDHVLHFLALDGLLDSGKCKVLQGRKLVVLGNDFFVKYNFYSGLSSYSARSCMNSHSMHLIYTRVQHRFCFC